MMLENLRIICLVPARAGSKGFPLKNLAKLSGVSLVERAVGVAIRTKGISDVFVSSDSQEILSRAANMGAKIRFRPAEFSSDSATATQVVQDFLDHLKVSGGYSHNDFILYLQPTSPLRTVHMLEQAIAQLSIGAKSVVSVSKFEHHPYKAVTILKDGRVAPLYDEMSLSANRQDFPEAFHCDANFFLFNIGLFLERGTFPISGSQAVASPIGSNHDIDTPQDLELIESRMKTGDLTLD